MKHYLLQPEVAGGLGTRTVVGGSRMQDSFVSSAHCELDGWMGDDLIESFPCYLVTEKLAGMLAKARLSGFELGDVEITTSPNFKLVHPGSALPRFRWLKISGSVDVHDFWIENDQSLAVSDRAWQLLEKFHLQHCSVRHESV